MEQHIICPNCGATAATLNLSQATPPPPPVADDSVAIFAEVHCRLRTDATTPTSDLYAAYTTWAEQVGRTPASAKQFSMLLSQLPGVERRRTKNARMFAGIALAK